MGRGSARPRAGSCRRARRSCGPLPPAASQELAALLTPPAERHPWPPTIPSSRFGQLPPEPVHYTPTEPLVIVEVDAVGSVPSVVGPGAGGLAEVEDRVHPAGDQRRRCREVPRAAPTSRAGSDPRCNPREVVHHLVVNMQLTKLGSEPFQICRGWCGRPACACQ
jgi:hypothetical protein